jgi:class 3 adenylate cyclase
MPIYMDVHRNVTAAPEEVALLHAMDQQIQEKYDVKYTRYWYNQDAGSVYCLVEAPSIVAALKVHKEAHGLVPDQVIEVEMDQVDAFLGEDHARHGDTDSIDGGFRVVMFTDMQDSTALTEKLGDERFFKLLESHDSLIREALRGHDGREVKHTGDGLFASFGSAVRAVECAIAIQRALADRKVVEGDPLVHVRIGLTAGEPVASHEDLFGATVNLAARICAYAQPEQILTSNVVRELCVGRPLRFSDIAAADLKGFEQPVTLHEVQWRST